MAAHDPLAGPRRDTAAILLAAVLFVLGLPLLAGLAVGAFVTRLLTLVRRESATQESSRARHAS